MAHVSTIPPKPAALVVLPDSIPVALKALDQWVVWRYFWLEDRQKWDKPPLQARSGNKASSTDRKTWSPFDVAMTTYETGLFDGVGFVLTKKNRLTAIDLDHCRDPQTNDIAAWALEIVERFSTYTELSPSGGGLHLIAMGTLPGKGVKTPHGEMYDTARYITTTGHRLEMGR
jgi:primase-polymerase (primpol)-like protein